MKIQNMAQQESSKMKMKEKRKEILAQSDQMKTW